MTNRLRRILNMATIIQSESNCKIDDFAEMFDISRRTVLRDLKALRESGFPCDFNPQENNYKFNENNLCPSPRLTREEALSFFLLITTARKYFQMPFGKSALSAATKIKSQLPKNIKDYCDSILQYITVFPEPYVPSTSLTNTFSDLLSAINYKRKITITYIDESNTKVLYNFVPLNLLHREYSWFLIGRTQEGTGKLIRLNRIKECAITTNVFCKENIDKNIISSFKNLSQSNHSYHVKIKLLPPIPEHIINTRWHHSQKISASNNGALIIEFKVGDLEEIVHWCMSLGDNIKIIQPEKLREMILEKSKRIVELNQNECGQTGEEKCITKFSKG